MRRGDPVFRRIKAISLIVAIFLLSACTVGPDFQPPGSVADELSAFIGTGEEQQQEGGDKITKDNVPGWWRNLDDPVLNSHIDKLLENNLQLKQARARIRQAWAQRGIEASDLYPHLSTNAEARRSFSPSANFTTGIPGASGGGLMRVFDNNIEATLATSWQLDLFGRIRRETQSAGAAARAALDDKRALAQSLIAEAARRRVAIRDLKQRRDVQQNIVETRKRALAATERRYKQGTDDVTVNDLHTSGQSLSNAKGELESLKQDLRTEYNRLDVLLGRAPQARDKQPTPELDAPAAATPDIVPARLIDRRPDLRASVLRYKAANADIGVAVANLYPDFSISGSIGSQSERAGNFLTSSKQIIGSIMADVTQRLFQGGALRANIDLQEAEAREQAAQYAEDVLNAVSEVETALSDNARLLKRAGHQDNGLSSLRLAEKSAERRYEKGVASLLEFLEVKRRRLEAQASLIRTRQAAWNARISLYLALGGDWLQDKDKDKDKNKDSEQARNSTTKQETDQNG